MDVQERPEMSFSEQARIYAKYTDISGLMHVIDRLGKTIDPEMRTSLSHLILSRLDALRQRFPGAENMQELPEVDSTGEFKIGNILLNADTTIDLRLSRDDFNKNILIAASVGHGKTSLIYRMAGSLEESDVKYFIFDSKKDYESLALDDDTVYLDDGSLRINPLEPPPAMSYREWAVHFADFFSHSFALLIGSRDFLLECVLKLYSKWSKDYPPSLHDLADYMESLGERSEYLNVTKGRIKALLASTVVFDCNRGIAMRALDKLNVVFGVDRLGMPEQAFLVSVILSHLFYMNLNDPTKRGRLNKVVFIDDAHTILDVNRERDIAMGLPILHGIISKMRELGVGFVFSDQQVSTLLSTAIQNSNMKFIGRINLNADVSKLFGRNADDADAQVGLLKPGMFLLISQKASPFCTVVVDRVVVNKKVSKDLIKLGRYRYRDALDFYCERSDMERREQELTSLFLKELSEHPSSNLSSHIVNLSAVMDQIKFGEIRQRLLAKGDISELSVPLSPDKTAKFLFIRKGAKDIVGQIGKLQDFEPVEFKKVVLKHLLKQKLKMIGTAFSEDENGLLISGINKIYITFMDDGSGLPRLLETSFDRVIDVVDETMTEREILSRIFEHSDKNSLVNISALKITTLKDFSL